MKIGQPSGDEGEGQDQVHIAHQTALRFPVQKGRKMVASLTEADHQSHAPGI